MVPWIPDETENQELFQLISMPTLIKLLKNLDLPMQDMSLP